MGVADSVPLPRLSSSRAYRTPSLGHGDNLRRYQSELPLRHADYNLAAWVFVFKCLIGDAGLLRGNNPVHDRTEYHDYSRNLVGEDDRGAVLSGSVNTVGPGGVPTEFTRGDRGGLDCDERLSWKSPSHSLATTTT